MKKVLYYLLKVGKGARVPSAPLRQCREDHLLVCVQRLQACCHHCIPPQLHAYCWWRLDPENILPGEAASIPVVDPLSTLDLEPEVLQREKPRYYSAASAFGSCYAL